MKKIATLASVIFITLLFNTNKGLAQAVNSHRSFTWDSWPANSLSQPTFFTNLGPDNVNVGVSISFSGTPSVNVASTYKYANQSGRISSLKIEKLPGSEDTMQAKLTFNKDLEGFSMEINPYSNNFTVVEAYNKAGTRVHVAGAYDIGYTDSAARIGDTLQTIGNKDIHIYFASPVASVTFKAVRTNGAANGMQFAVGAVSWFNSSDYTPNPDLKFQCDGNQVLLLLDASSSIDATERSELIGAVESMLNTLQFYATTPNYIAVVEFSQKARLSLDFTKVTAAAIAPGGAIYNYLHNTDGNGYYSTNALYGGYTDWPYAFKIALDEARLQKPNLLIFFTDGAPNRIYETNDGNSSNLLYSASWGVNRTQLYADTIKQMGTHILGIGVDRINTTTQDFYFRYPIEMANPILYDYITPPPSNLPTADYVTVPAFPFLKQVFNNLFFACLNYLPLSFSSIKVQQQNCTSNTISWKMEDESGGTYYTVEKSTDGSQFNVIGRVERSQANQNGQYMFDDNKLDARTIYYRVKAVTTSGKPIYSKVVMVQTPCLNNQLVIWPNPVRSDKLSLRLQSPYTGILSVAVHDMAGRLVLKQSITKNQEILMVEENVSGLSIGMYTLMVSDHQNQVLFKDKFVKQ